jgi:hypothetical protein
MERYSMHGRGFDALSAEKEREGFVVGPVRIEIPIVAAPRIAGLPRRVHRKRLVPLPHFHSAGSSPNSLK